MKITQAIKHKNYNFYYTFFRHKLGPNFAPKYLTSDLLFPAKK